MADSPSSRLSFRGSVDRLGSEEFDSSVFETLAGGDARRDHDDDPDDAGAGGPTVQREGLPPGFRMRHDAHYVEQLTSRRNVTRVGGSASAAGPARAVDAGRACGPLLENLEGMAACLALFGDARRSSRERAALRLISDELSQARWLVQALSLLQHDPPVVTRPVALEAMARRVLAAFEPPSWDPPARVEMGHAAGGLAARGDERLLGVAVAGMITAVRAVADEAAGSVVQVSVEEDSTGHARLAVAEKDVRLPQPWRARFVDGGWTDRPGGCRASVMMAAAVRIAELHRGTLALDAAEHDGCRLVLSLPRG